jgi:hypothetical protein
MKALKIKHVTSNLNHSLADGGAELHRVGHGQKHLCILCFSERAEVLSSATEGDSAVHLRLQTFLGDKAAGFGSAAGLDPAHELFQRLAEAVLLDAEDITTGNNGAVEHYARERTAEAALGQEASTFKLDLLLSLLCQNEDFRGPSDRLALVLRAVNDKKCALVERERDTQGESLPFRWTWQEKHLASARAQRSGHCDKRLVNCLIAVEGHGDAVDGVVCEAHDLKKNADSLGELADAWSLNRLADDLDRAGEAADFLEKRAGVGAVVDGVEAEGGLVRHCQ